MKTNAKIGLSVGVALIIGYLSGSFIGWPNSDNSLLSGSIGKVNKYGKSTVSPELKALQERMKTDKDFREKTALSFSLLDENGVKDVAQTMTEGEKKAVFAPIEVLSMDKSKTEAEIQSGTLSDVYANGFRDLINNSEALQKRSNAIQTEQQFGNFKNSRALGVLKNDGSMVCLFGAIFNPLFAISLQ